MTGERVEHLAKRQVRAEAEQGHLEEAERAVLSQPVEDLRQVLVEQMYRFARIDRPRLDLELRRIAPIASQEAHQRRLQREHSGRYLERLAIPPTERSFTRYFARVPKDTEVLYHVMVGPGAMMATCTSVRLLGSTGDCSSVTEDSITWPIN